MNPRWQRERTKDALPLEGKFLVVGVVLRFDNAVLGVPALVDCGTRPNHMEKDFAHVHGIGTRKLERPVIVEVADGQGEIADAVQ